MQIAGIEIALEVIFIGWGHASTLDLKLIRVPTRTHVNIVCRRMDRPFYIYACICVHIGLFISAAGNFINILVQAFHENKMDGAAGRSPEAPRGDYSIRRVLHYNNHLPSTIALHSALHLQ